MKTSEYKETELGLIPADWTVKQIGKIGYTYSGLTGKGKDDFGKGDAKFITFLNVLNNPILRTDIFEKVNVLEGEHQNTAQKGDLFFNTSSETPEEVGICAMLNDDIPNLYLNSFCFGYRITDPEVDGIYLAYFFRSKLGRDIMSTLAQGATRYNLSKEYFNKTLIALPPLNEQIATAKAISEIDELLKTMDFQIEKKLLIKAGLMQDLLTGNRRLPGYNTEWETVRLKDCGKLITEGISPFSYPNNMFFEYSMPAYDLGKEPRYVPGSQMNSNRFLIHGKVLLYNKLNVRQKRVWYIEKCKPNALCSMEFLPFTSQKLDLCYLSYALLQDSVTDYFNSISKGTSNSQKRITPSDFLDYEVMVPKSKEEQEKIALILKSVDDEIKELQHERDKHLLIKQGMMQELLTGKTRL